MQIFLARNGTPVGPFAPEQLKEMVRAGTAHPDEQAWYEGGHAWVPLRHIPGFAAPSPWPPAATPIEQPYGTLSGYAPPEPRTTFGQRSPYASLEPAPTHPIGAPVQFAGFWLRVAACLIDAVVLFVPQEVIDIMIGGGGWTTRNDDPARLSVAMGANLFVWWLYTAVLTSSSWEGTLGKKALGLRVVDINGNRITFLHATGRYLAEFLSSCTLGIGLLMVAFTEKKQALHDMLASTYVVRGKA